LIILCRDDGVEIADENLFKNIVESLMFLTTTRPTIIYVVMFVSRYMIEPLQTHMREAMRILKHVKGTLNFDIHYDANCKIELVGYRELDWSTSLHDKNKLPIAWRLNKNSIIILSSTKVEYVETTTCTIGPKLIMSFLQP